MAAIAGTSDFRPLATSPSAKITGVHESLLQESEKDIIWYRENFFGKEHANYLAVDSPRGPMAVSVIRDGNVFKALVRTTQGSERLTIQTDAVPVPFHRKALHLGPTMKTVLSTMSKNIPIFALKRCKDPSLPNELLAMEERQVIRSYKFGLGYLKNGQVVEEDMFSNQIDKISPEFKQFLNFLGETIDLKGWKGYRAGLDVNNNSTGTQSVYTKWQGYEIMFHVSPFLPYSTQDRQQLERKRHIGNDIVVIVFQDEGASESPFQLSTLTSHQNHVVAMVSSVKETPGSYKVQMFSKTGVPIFTPEWPESCVLNSDPVSRDFFLHKLINGERASYKAPSFAPKISRTRGVLLYDVAYKFLNR